MRGNSAALLHTPQHSTGATVHTKPWLKVVNSGASWRACCGDSVLLNSTSMIVATAWAFKASNNCRHSQGVSQHCCAKEHGAAHPYPYGAALARLCNVECRTQQRGVDTRQVASNCCGSKGACYSMARDLVVLALLAKQALS